MCYITFMLTVDLLWAWPLLVITIIHIGQSHYVCSVHTACVSLHIFSNLCVQLENVPVIREALLWLY